MYDRFARKIHYLRISVTDRCNLKCMYCIPNDDIRRIDNKDILSYEEIYRIVKKAAELGIDKIRLTGGEPLVRKNIVALVSMLSDIEGIHDLSMTTNAILLKTYAPSLVHAGLQRVNISLDTLDPAKYKEITRGGDIRHVLNGIKAAQQAGFSEIKINCVIRESPEEHDAQSVARFAAERRIPVRFIREMNMKTGTFWQVIGGEGGNCSQCNRLRLTSNGYIYPCLFSDHAFSVRKLDIEEAFRQAVQSKPVSGMHREQHCFYAMGG